MKKLEKGFTLVELLVVIAILGILMVALVPNILGAITKSQMQTMAKQGADIVNAINTEVRKSLWPRAAAAAGGNDSEEDIYTKAYTSSTEYFKDLFDIENQTSGEHDPFIDVKIECLWGNGVDKASPGQLTRDNVAWTILAGAKDAPSGGIPALVSRNVDTSLFPVSGNHDMYNRRDRVKLFDIPPFGTHGAVIVTRDGSVRYISARDGTIPLNQIYERSPSVKIPQTVKLKYLHP
jgi:prepilin-type N-terminal cleavage/methylation domain-containing protein